MHRLSVLLVVSPLVLMACGKLNGPCEVNDDCRGGQTCEVIQGEDSKFCAAPLIFTGAVFNAVDDVAIAGAQVAAVDENGAPASEIATTAADGTYQLTVSAERLNDDNRTPVGTFTLRAAASDF